MSSIYSIYKATNSINGKIYIGFDSNWPNRKETHQKKYTLQTQKFYTAIRKYGWDSFEWEIVYQSKEANHCLKIMEPFFIKEYDSYNSGYNMTLGGEGVLGYKHNSDRREKIRLNNIGRKQSPETKKLRSEIGKKVWLTRERTVSMEQRKKISNALMGNIPWNKGKKTGKPSPNCKPVIIEGVFYSSKQAAMTKLGVSLHIINKLITSGATHQQ